MPHNTLFQRTLDSNRARLDGYAERAVCSDELSKDDRVFRPARRLVPKSLSVKWL